MYECLSVCISVYHLCWKRVLNSLELDLWVVVSIHVGAGTWSSVSCRSGQCSEPLIHLCSPRNNFQHCKWGKEDSSLFGPLHHAPLMVICGRQRLLFSIPFLSGGPKPPAILLQPKMTLLFLKPMGEAEVKIRFYPQCLGFESVGSCWKQ